MDKRIIFAVAGAGKTSYLVDALHSDKRSLIITYTDNNYKNLSKKITVKFNGIWPQNVSLMTYFQFLYQFCYKPFLADKVKAKGITFNAKPSRYIKKNDPNYCKTQDGYFYSSRLALFLEQENIINDIIRRLEKYFDEFFIDEIQDIAGRDFDFLEKLMHAEIEMLFVGDFYQHTYNTSRDGNFNQNLFKDYDFYKERFLNQGFKVDTNTLVNSWRCSKNICDFITTNLGVMMGTNRDISDNTSIEFVSDEFRIREIIEDPNIIKLHYQKGPEFGKGHINWGASKGQDDYQDVCVLLNKNTFQKYSVGKLNELPAETKNKLYVAITRAHGNCYLVEGQ